MMISAQTLTIQQGQGLTQALLGHVRSQGVTTPITAAQWDATIDKLAELQQKRKENNLANIFSGGTDKNNWSKSFVVQPNQQIEFSEEEMESLYNAMGLSFTKSLPESDEPDEITETDEIDEIDEVDEPEEPEGNQIEEIYNDGELSSIIEHNDGVFIKQTFYLDGDINKVKSVNEYNPDGSYSQTTFYVDGDTSKVDHITNYENGVRTRHTSYVDGNIDKIKAITDYQNINGTNVPSKQTEYIDGDVNRVNSITTYKNGNKDMEIRYQNGEVCSIKNFGSPYSLYNNDGSFKSNSIATGLYRQMHGIGSDNKETLRLFQFVNATNAADIFVGFANNSPNKGLVTQARGEWGTSLKEGYVNALNALIRQAKEYDDIDPVFTGYLEGLMEENAGSSNYSRDVAKKVDAVALKLAQLIQYRQKSNIL